MIIIVFILLFLGWYAFNYVMLNGGLTDHAPSGFDCAWCHNWCSTEDAALSRCTYCKQDPRDWSNSHYKENP